VIENHLMKSSVNYKVNIKYLLTYGWILNPIYRMIQKIQNVAQLHLREKI